jgi:hypothetical protein
MDMREQKMLVKNRVVLTAMMLSSMFLISCSNERQNVAGLYNVDSLIKTQINYLIGHEASISKKAILNGAEKNTTISPKDTADWAKELAIFLELDVVNKPINKNAYKIENYADNKSNLRVKSFMTTEDLPVKFLRVYYYRSMRSIRKIEAKYQETNSLYSSTRFLTMEFENIYNKTVLTSYAIAGGQKMFLDDSVQYTIGASIALKK